MFISGQLFDNAATDAGPAASDMTDEVITYHGKPLEVKDRLNRFRATDDFIWNNPYRATSGKVRSFYHAKDQEFKRKFHPRPASSANLSCCAQRPT